MNVKNQLIIDILIDYIVEISLANEYNHKNLPLDESLIEIGVLDSYGIIELVEFIESKWCVVVSDEDITKEKMGSIIKMANLISLKLE